MGKKRIVGIGLYRMTSFQTCADINGIRNQVRSRLESGINLTPMGSKSAGYSHASTITSDAQIVEIISKAVDEVLNTSWCKRALSEVLLEQFSNDRDKCIDFITRLIKSEIDILNTMLPVSEEQAAKDQEELDVLRVEQIENSYAKDAAKELEEVDIAKAIKDKDIDSLFDLIGEKVFEMRRRDNYPIRPPSWDLIAQVYSISSGMVKKIRSHDGYKALLLKAFDDIDQKAIDKGALSGDRLWPTSYAKNTLAKVIGYIGELEIPPQRLA